MAKREMSRNWNEKYVSPVPTNEPVESTVPVETNELGEDIKKDTITEEATTKTDKPVFGKVVNCVRLNIREKASKESMSIGVLDKGTEVQVVEAESTDKFYKIIAPTGMEGYCMKKFVAVPV